MTPVTDPLGPLKRCRKCGAVYGHATWPALPWVGVQRGIGEALTLEGNPILVVLLGDALAAARDLNFALYGAPDEGAHP